VLEQGELAVSCRLDGVESVLPAVAVPGYVGELGLINSAPRSATIVTAANSRLLRMDAEDFGDACTLSRCRARRWPRPASAWAAPAQPIARLPCRLAGDEAG
jgi:CRP-like cAMP-binding protein